MFTATFHLVSPGLSDQGSLVRLPYRNIWNNTEDADSGTGGIFIRDTACSHSYAMSYDQIRVKPHRVSYRVYHGVAKYGV